MTSSPYHVFNRPTNRDKTDKIINDDENPLTWNLNSFSGNKFFSGVHKAYTLEQLLFREERDKYTNRYAAMLKAETETQALPICFEGCISDVTTGLSVDEKNCVRECVLRRMSVRDDWQLTIKQKQALENMRYVKEVASV